MREKRIPEKGRLVWVEEVFNKDPETDKPVAVQIQYFKDGKLLHDLVFVRVRKNGRNWVMPAPRETVGGFVPKNRYQPMAKKACAILYDDKGKKAVKPAKQLDLPFQHPFF